MARRRGVAWRGVSGQHSSQKLQFLLSIFRSVRKSSNFSPSSCCLELNKFLSSVSFTMPRENISRASKIFLGSLASSVLKLNASQTFLVSSVNVQRSRAHWYSFGCSDSFVNNEQSLHFCLQMVQAAQRSTDKSRVGGFKALFKTSAMTLKLFFTISIQKRSSTLVRVLAAPCCVLKNCLNINEATNITRLT